MEIILVKPVRKLGKIGEILKVKNGFARNYLIPKEFAIRATEHNKNIIEQQKANLEEQDKQIKEEAEKVNILITNKKLTFIKQAADDGKLFGSVNNKEIAENLSTIISNTISPANVVLEKQIKFVGLFPIEIKLHPDLSAFITVVVARSESEAQNYMKEQAEEQL